MANQNENSAAVRRSAPSSIADTIVAPDRDTPGIIAAHWKMPMPKYIGSENLVTSWYFGLSGIESIQNNTPAPRISVTQTIQGLNKTVLMKSCASAPTTAAGRNAINTPMTN